MQSEPYYTLVHKNSFEVYSGRSVSKAGQYLLSRGIDPKAVAPYLHDVTFSDKGGKPKKGFGIENVSGGFEIRRAGDWAKIAVGHKDVSVFLASRDHAPWHTFYSMIDFCTFLCLDKPPIGTYNYLIVNGDGLVEKAEKVIESLPVGTMIHYPHSDLSGQKAYQRLLQFATDLGWGGGDRAHLYEGFKDWTEKRENELGLDRKVVATPQGVPGFKPRLG
ncbi:hypothetical protein LZD49_33685 [Dyadobacter sp. CY261]|uniref:hypothetical protein n=1 Tax=Dyadobacter sp. CY261 TaxID=2907203 RepID=UPI001F3FB596|nr:hypothetical protein [Dyadobacter sp. CY261]MCF0075479.1 hypothetical protein [Dyadobacter sp. CY261]